MKPFLIALLISLLSACGTFQQDCRPKYETHVVEVPEVLLKQAALPNPPPKEEYMKQSDKERERTLTLYIAELMKVVQSDRQSFIAIKKFNDGEKALREKGSGNDK